EHLALRVPLREQQAELATTGKPVDAAEVLARGVTDIRGALYDSSVTQILTMGLEAVYQGLGFSRAIVFVRNPVQQKGTAHMCVGAVMLEHMATLSFDET